MLECIQKVREPVRTKENFRSPELTQEECRVFIEAWRESERVEEVIFRLIDYSTFPVGPFEVLRTFSSGRASRIDIEHADWVFSRNRYTPASRGTGWAFRQARDLRANGIHLRKLPRDISPPGADHFPQSSAVMEWREQKQRGRG